MLFLFVHISAHKKCSDSGLNMLEQRAMLLLEGVFILLLLGGSEGVLVLQPMQESSDTLSAKATHAVNQHARSKASQLCLHLHIDFADFMKSLHILVQTIMLSTWNTKQRHQYVVQEVI